jgi:adenine phosphoribosyltransferase
MNLENYIRDIPNFPIEGVMFKDISPLLSHPAAFKESIDRLANFLQGADCIV